MSARKAQGRPTIAAQNRALIEKAFPGVECSRVSVEMHRFPDNNGNGDCYPNRTKYTLKACVTATASVLISHGLTTREDIDSLPPSGCRSDMRLLHDGRIKYSACWMDWHTAPTVARDMVKKLGLIEPPGDEAPLKHVHSEQNKRRTGSNVIPFPVKNPRVAFMHGLATGVTLHLPSEVKVELLAKALACLGLRMGSMDGGRLVARWDTYSNLTSDLDGGTGQ